MSKKKEHENLMPVFQLVPQSDSRIKCKYVGTIPNEKLGELTDEIIETKDFFDNETNDDTFNLGIVNGYQLYGKYCIANITGSHLTSNIKLPVFYFSMLYTKTFVGGCLCNATIFFTIDESSVKKLNDPKKYVGTIITGKYTCELVFPEESDILNSMKPIIEERIMKKYVDNFVNTEDDDAERQKVVDQIGEDVNNVINKLSEYIQSCDIEYFPTKKNVLLKTFRPFYKSPKFTDLMNYCLLYRDDERIKKRCPDMAFEAPTKYTSLKELGKKLEDEKEI
jgi:hypothetical protein